MCKQGVRRNGDNGISSNDMVLRYLGGARVWPKQNRNATKDFSQSAGNEHAQSPVNRTVKQVEAVEKAD